MPPWALPLQFSDAMRGPQMKGNGSKRGSSDAQVTSEEARWFLLRRAVCVNGTTFLAGSLVEYCGGRSYLYDTGLTHKSPCDLPLEVLYRLGVHEQTLYQVIRHIDGSALARRVLSTEDSFEITAEMLCPPVKPGDSRVCVRFGSCFLPIEFFNW